MCIADDFRYILKEVSGTKMAKIKQKKIVPEPIIIIAY
jgi:hypothetical protein